jgi:orotate phosphoribosyltransferase
LTNNKERLREFIKEHGIVFKHVKLSSNIESDYYYDLKSIAFNPHGVNLLGDLLLEEVRKYHAKSVGGLEMGAIPLASAIAIKSIDKYDDGINPFVIRKNPKLHGLEKKIEGEVKAPVVIVDDVVTSGNSIYDAITAVIDVTKFSVEGVVCVIDREEERITNVLKEKHIKYSALFRHSEFKPFIEERLRNNQQNQKSSI